MAYVLDSFSLSHLLDSLEWQGALPGLRTSALQRASDRLEVVPLLVDLELTIKFRPRFIDGFLNSGDVAKPSVIPIPFPLALVVLRLSNWYLNNPYFTYENVDAGTSSSKAISRLLSDMPREVQAMLLPLVSKTGTLNYI